MSYHPFTDMFVGDYDLFWYMTKFTSDKMMEEMRCRLSHLEVPTPNND